MHNLYAIFVKIHGICKQFAVNLVNESGNVPRCGVDENGNIKESIKIITHSMGSAYAKGYVKSLLKYFRDNNLPTGLIEFEADFAPYQPDKQIAAEGVDTYQLSH